MAENTSLMAVAGKLTANVETKIGDMLKEKRLDLPEDYSASNALKAAQLAIMEVQDKDHRPALSVCTPESVIQSMLSMVVQGLNPDKKQCYFICYGKKLTLMRSYFGAMAVAKRVDPNIEDIVAQVVYKSEKDGFKMEIQPNGKFLVTQHVPDIFGSRTRDDIVGAYATVTYKDGTAWSEFRNFQQIKDAWTHSQRKVIDEKGNIKEGTVHYTETEDMCRRTIINRVCKVIINASSDSSIVAQYAKQTTADMEKAEAEERIDTNLSTGELVDIIDEPEEIEVVSTVVNEPAPDPTPEPVKEAEAPKKKSTAKSVKKDAEAPVVEASEPEPAESFSDIDNPFKNI